MKLHGKKCFQLRFSEKKHDKIYETKCGIDTRFGSTFWRIQWMHLGCFFIRSWLFCTDVCSEIASKYFRNVHSKISSSKKKRENQIDTKMHLKNNISYPVIWINEILSSTTEPLFVEIRCRYKYWFKCLISQFASIETSLFYYIAI